MVKGMMATQKSLRLWVTGLALSLLLSGCSKEQEAPRPAKEALTAQTAAAPESQDYRAVTVKQGGSISGHVVFKGKATRSKLLVGKDQEVCGKAKADPALIIGGQGEVKDAVVHISDIRQGKAPVSKNAVLDQLRCEYVPHVLAISAGTTVTIKNSDGILHNVHSLSKDNPPFNRAQPKYLKEFNETFAEAEIIPVRCDVHGWMSAWIFVAANPYYALTLSDGKFKLTDVPPGSYTLAVWHGMLGQLTQKVAVKPNETVNVTFAFTEKK